MRDNTPLFIIIGATIILIILLLILSFMPQDNSNKDNNSNSSNVSSTSSISSSLSESRVLIEKDQEPIQESKYAIDEGFKREVFVEGTGELTKANDVITVDYIGTLESNGTKFDSSIDRGSPFKFTLGVGQVISGWDQGMSGLPVGSIVRLTLPSDFAYGENGSGAQIPPKSTLIFDVEIIAVNS